MNIKCMVNFHDWSKIDYFRRCKECGKLQVEPKFWDEPGWEMPSNDDRRWFLLLFLRKLIK